MCILCKNIGKSIRELQYGDIIMLQNPMYTYVGEGEPHPVPLIYCPLCGERVRMKVNVVG